VIKLALVTSLFAVILLACSADPADVYLSCPSPEAGSAPEASPPDASPGKLPQRPKQAL
jgi:hypothetical protein